LHIIAAHKPEHKHLNIAHYNITYTHTEHGFIESYRTWFQVSRFIHKLDNKTYIRYTAKTYINSTTHKIDNKTFTYTTICSVVDLVAMLPNKPPVVVDDMHIFPRLLQLIRQAN
jgi:hypothetical protein